MRIVVLLATLFCLISACSGSGGSRFEAIRPSHDGFCSTACQTARSSGASCSNWSAPELVDAHIQECIDSTPCGNDPDYACGSTPSTTYDWDCYVGCVMMESAAVQDRVLENLRCDFPAACR